MFDFCVHLIRFPQEHLETKFDKTPLHLKGCESSSFQLISSFLKTSLRQNFSFFFCFRLLQGIFTQFHTVFSHFVSVATYTGFRLVRIFKKMLPLPVNFQGRDFFFIVKKKKTQNLEGLWGFQYEPVMASTIPRPSYTFIFILTSQSPILSLLFFSAIFIQNLTFSAKENRSV